MKIPAIFAAIWKNLLRLFRSRVSTAAILFGPLLLIVVIGIAFTNTDLRDIKVGVYSASTTDEVNQILDNLKQTSDTFRITEFEVEQDCVDSVSEGEAHICMTIAPQGEGKQTEVTFHVDYSRLTLVWMLLESMNSRLSDEATSIGTAVSTELLQKFDKVYDYLEDAGNSMSNISSSRAELLSGIETMESQIDSLDLTAPDADLGDVQNQADAQKKVILEQQKQIDREIKNSRDDLADTRQELVNAKNDLSQAQDDLDEYISQVVAGQTALGCTVSNSEDLSGYLGDDVAFRQALEGSERPDCSVLLTTEINMRKAKEEAEATESAIDEGIDRIDEADKRLENFQKESKKSSENAIKTIDGVSSQLGDLQSELDSGTARLEDMESMRSEMLKDIAVSKKSLSDTGVLVDSLQAGMKDVKESLSEVTTLTPEAIISPFKTGIKPVNEDDNKLSFFFPSLLAVVLLFVSVLAASTIVMKERSSRAHFRNHIAPKSRMLSFVGVLLTALILAFLQVIIISLIGSFAFGINILQSPIDLVVACLLSVTLFSLIGMIFGFIFTSEETTTLFSVIICVIFFVISSTMIPLESMNPSIYMFAQLNPYVLSEFLLRRVLIFDTGLGLTTLQFMMLLAEILILGAVAVFSMLYARRKV